MTVDITLNIGSQAQTVEVSGDAPLIDTQSAEQATNLSGELLRNIPITGRHDWSDSLQITPGASLVLRATQRVDRHIFCADRRMRIMLRCWTVWI